MDQASITSRTLILNGYNLRTYGGRMAIDKKVDDLRAEAIEYFDRVDVTLASELKAAATSKAFHTVLRKEYDACTVRMKSGHSLRDTALHQQDESLCMRLRAYMQRITPFIFQEEGAPD
jgi:hypothetical protein